MSAAQTEDPWTRWIELSDSSIRPEDVNNILSPVRDDLWVVTACVDRLLDTPDAQRALLDLGIVRTLGASERSQLVYNGDVDEEVAQLSAEDVANKEDALLKYWQASPDARLCHMRAVLLHRLDRLNTFVEMCIEFKPTDDELPTSEEDTNLGGEEWEDDPWASEADETSTTAEEAPKSLVGDHSSSDKAMPISLSLFLSEGLAHSASLLASLEQFPALKILFDRHADELWPHRLSILERIPEHAHPEDYRDILPSYNVNAERERRPADHPWRTDTDWTELSTIQSLLERNFPDLLIPTHTIDLAQKSEPLTSTALVEWYITTADRIMSVAGMIDIALELIQHGASQGLPSLAELGEDLSLLSRLIYDAPTGPLGPSVDDWTLRRWRAMEPLEVVQAYLAYSTPASIVSDIRTLVQPYLFVIESRAERAGKPDPELPTRLLYQYVLSAPLHLVAAIFDASKPIYPAAQRLLKSDEDLARLALSCLYGSPTLDAWPTMSRIFECMPAWNFAADVDDNGEAAETTATSLGAFVTPTVQRPRATPAELLLFFQPLDAPALSRALDILDVHLESGEILARWGVPAPLRWFLQSRSDEREQRTWAVRMSRRADNFGERVDTEDTWEWLLDDMLKLAGSGESGLRGAFGLLSRDEVIRIFFSGVISAGG
jgi:neuroblastoma-amplified sequence